MQAENADGFDQNAVMASPGWQLAFEGLTEYARAQYMPKVEPFILLYQHDGYWWMTDTLGKHSPERTSYTSDWSLDAVLEATRKAQPLRLIVADPRPR